MIEEVQENDAQLKASQSARLNEVFGDRIAPQGGNAAVMDMGGGCPLFLPPPPRHMGNSISDSNICSHGYVLCNILLYSPLLISCSPPFPLFVVTVMAMPPPYIMHRVIMSTSLPPANCQPVIVLVMLATRPPSIPAVREQHMLVIPEMVVIHIACTRMPVTYCRSIKCSGIPTHPPLFGETSLYTDTLTLTPLHFLDDTKEKQWFSLDIEKSGFR